MENPDGKVELVKIEDFVIDNNLSRPNNLHVVLIDGDDPEYYAINGFQNKYVCSWQTQCYF